jgi:hypothetical protein
MAKSDNGNEVPDFYRLFVEHVTLRLKNKFDMFTVSRKYNLKKKSCRVNCHGAGITASLTGNNTLCRLVDLTENERGKLEWFSSSDRRENNGRIPKKFILIFYRDPTIKKVISDIEESYKADGQPKAPYNFATHYVTLAQDTSKW